MAPLPKRFEQDTIPILITGVPVASNTVFLREHHCSAPKITRNRLLLGFPLFLGVVVSMPKNAIFLRYICWWVHAIDIYTLKAKSVDFWEKNTALFDRRNDFEGTIPRTFDRKLRVEIFLRSSRDEWVIVRGHIHSTNNFGSRAKWAEWDLMKRNNTGYGNWQSCGDSQRAHCRLLIGRKWWKK